MFDASFGVLRMNYKETLNLPKTEFPMKANLTVREPEIFLFDEPLSNLDAELRVQMRIELSKLHSGLQTTMIYVTHDQVEAMTLAEKIVVLNDGNVEQIG